MVSKIDLDIASGRSLGGTNAPILREGLRTVNGRSIVAHRLIDIIGAPITAYGSLRGCSRRTPGSPAVNDIVLDERISRPSIERQISIAGR